MALDLFLTWDLKRLNDSQSFPVEVTGSSWVTWGPQPYFWLSSIHRFTLGGMTLQGRKSYTAHTHIPTDIPFQAADFPALTRETSVTSATSDTFQVLVLMWFQEGCTCVGVLPLWVCPLRNCCIITGMIERALCEGQNVCESVCAPWTTVETQWHFHRQSHIIHKKPQIKVVNK